MKLKLKNEDFKIFMAAMSQCEYVTFNTKLEQRVCASILKDFIRKSAKKAIDNPDKVSITLDDQTLLTLNFVLPQLRVEEIYTQTIVKEVHAKINQQCLNI